MGTNLGMERALGLLFPGYGMKSVWESEGLGLHPSSPTFACGLGQVMEPHLSNGHHGTM